MKSAVFAVLLLAGAAFAAPSLAPLLNKGKEIIPNSYIVVLHRDVEVAGAKAFADSVNANRFLQIGQKFKAFTGVFTPSMINKIRARTDLVKFVESDKVVRTFGTQTDATWGLDRSDQTDLPLDETFHYYDSAGAGVNAYIVDTGIRIGHNEFEDRAEYGYNFHDGTANAEDDNGHGTHVAGTVAGATYGLAKNATLIAVKVLGRLGSGSLTNVAAGVAWVAEQHNASSNKKTVANMSLGSSASTSMDQAVEAAIEEGVIFVLASGNSDDDACDYSPARVATAITVNASTNRDARASFSNYGSCTTLFAPGQDITSAYITSDSSVSTLSGTSMASPHVCGAVALLLGEEGEMTPAQAKARIIENATPDVISDIGAGSDNLLLYTPY